MRMLGCWIGLIALAGCAGETPDAGAGAGGTETNAVTESELAGPIERAREDLAKRLEIDSDDIEIDRAEFVTWRNGALGCPEPGSAYTQALVPGYRIVLRAGGERHHYHGGRDQAPFHCPAERVDDPVPGEPSDKT